jgi:hypothetical protein
MTWKEAFACSRRACNIEEHGIADVELHTDEILKSMEEIISNRCVCWRTPEMPWVVQKLHCSGDA